MREKMTKSDTLFLSVLGLITVLWILSLIFGFRAVI